jgi:hypothetical protein
MSGIDGGNPLGFLAALGVLRTTTRALPDANVRMMWQIEHGSWRPALICTLELSAGNLLDHITPFLKGMGGHSAFAFADDLALSADEFRAIACAAFSQAGSADRTFADFVSAFGCETLVTLDKEPKIQDTALRTMSGAGHQHFLGFMRELVEKTEMCHLHNALFMQWTYADDKPSLRWDPVDDRRYALRWREPSGDPVRTVRGANRLAIEALPLLPTAPVGKTLDTTGFVQRRKEGVFFTWPIWELPISLDVVRSLVSLHELQLRSPDRRLLRTMGIVEVYRSQRITQGKYRNFTSGMPA